MDNNRFIQILQETVNNQNAIINSLNSYISEVYSSTNNYDYNHYKIFYYKNQLHRELRHLPGRLPRQGVADLIIIIIMIIIFYNNY